MEKNSIPISDQEGTTFYRSSGISLVGQEEVGNRRILIPSRNNYETVLNVNQMSTADQLIVHMIYENIQAQKEVCARLRDYSGLERLSERFDQGVWAPLKMLYERTASILAKTDPNSFCSRINNINVRLYGANDIAENLSDDIVKKMPPFLRNLIHKCVAPETMKVETKTIMLRNCPTVHIDESGLVASVQLYNPITPRYFSKNESDYIRIETVVRFSGNAEALNENISMYCEHPLYVPVMLGIEVITTSNTNVSSSKRYFPDPESIVNTAGVPPLSREERLEETLQEPLIAAQ